MRLLVALLAALISGGAAEAEAQSPGDHLQVHLMTMGPGRDIYERFGHNAIWIRDTVTGREAVYNYGTFDASEPGFVTRFMMGRPRYWLADWSMAGTIRTYTAAQRDVEVQLLALPGEKRLELANLLARNALPENRFYTYDYYLDNCSTRVRDILDQVLDGALSRATVGEPAEGTLRHHTQRSISNSPFMYLGILAAIGPRADQPLDQWGEMFLPEKLQQRLRELQVVNDSGDLVPLVQSEEALLTFGVWQVEEAQPDWSGRLSLIGMVLAVIIATGLLGGKRGVAGRSAAVLWATIAGICSLVLLFLWLGTDHAVTAMNQNLLLLSPLAFGTLPALVRPNRVHRNWWDGATLLWMLGLAIASVMGLAAPLSGQDNREVLALTLLPGLATAFVSLIVTRRRASAPPAPR